MIITYIMGHTLTILESTLPTVISKLQHSRAPKDLPHHTSPKLANRQLKFFLSCLRTNIYKRILHWAQQVLRTSVKKRETWLHVFCAMIGFAMVLEEVQVTIQIQADAKITKGELSADYAYSEAYNACDRIDNRFKLMIGIFQCKYRDRNWGAFGSFGPGTPELDDGPSREFLAALRQLVVQKRESSSSMQAKIERLITAQVNISKGGKM